jgi:hypothetical protein
MPAAGGHHVRHHDLDRVGDPHEIHLQGAGLRGQVVDVEELADAGRVDTHVDPVGDRLREQGRELRRGHVGHLVGVPIVPDIARAARQAGHRRAGVEESARKRQTDPVGVSDDYRSHRHRCHSGPQ